MRRFKYKKSLMGQFAFPFWHSLCNLHQRDDCFSLFPKQWRRKFDSFLGKDVPVKNASRTHVRCDCSPALTSLLPGTEYDHADVASQRLPAGWAFYSQREDVGLQRLRG